MQIQSRASWGAAPPKQPLTPMDRPDGWVVHWVGVKGMNPAPTLAQSQALLRSIQSNAMSREYIDIEYSFQVDPLGRIFEGRGWAFKSGANGTTNYNSHAWAVCYLGGPGVPLTAAAKEALLWLTQEGARRSAAVSYVLAHRALLGVSTACPGEELAQHANVCQAHLHDDNTKVEPMYNPPLQLANVVASLNAPNGGAWALTASGAVYALGTAPYKGGANGQAYFAGRTAAQLAPFPPGGYTIVATSGERYDFP